MVCQVVANETKVVVQREEEEAAKKAAETQAIADDAQRDLDEALPALVSTNWNKERFVQTFNYKMPRQNDIGLKRLKERVES